MRTSFNGILALGLLLASASPSFAQTFGQITGQVTDASGGILVGASVTVTNTQTNAMREAQTNTSGSYAFPNLLPGVYNVKVDLQGFQSKVRNGIELQVQQTARLDFSLELGSVEVAVEVTGTAPMINATDATVGNGHREQTDPGTAAERAQLHQSRIAESERELGLGRRRRRWRFRKAGW